MKYVRTVSPINLGGPLEGGGVIHAADPLAELQQLYSLEFTTPEISARAVLVNSYEGRVESV